MLRRPRCPSNSWSPLVIEGRPFVKSDPQCRLRHGVRQFAVLFFFLKDPPPPEISPLPLPAPLPIPMVVQGAPAPLARVPVPADGGVSIEGTRIGSYADLVDFVVAQVNDEESRPYWVGSAVGLGTVNAFARRLIASKKDLARLIRGDLPTGRPHAVNTAESAQMTVVDLHNLPDRAQRFVVGVTLKCEFERKEKARTAKPLLFVVLDELHQY